LLGYINNLEIFDLFYYIAACEDDPNYADECPERAAEKDYCKDQEKFMKKQCPKSCGFCSEGKG